MIIVALILRLSIKKTVQNKSASYDWTSNHREFAKNQH